LRRRGDRHRRHELTPTLRAGRRRAGGREPWHHGGPRGGGAALRHAHQPQQRAARRNRAARAGHDRCGRRARGDPVVGGPARGRLDGDVTAFRDTLMRGLAMGFLVTIPATVGYLVLALPLARAISFGRMDSDGGVVMVAASLAALSLAVVGQTAFMIVTYACYARKDTRTPLMSMLVQTTICLGLASTALLLQGPAMLVVLGLALSLSVAAAAVHLTAHVWRTLSPRGTQRLAP